MGKNKFKDSKGALYAYTRKNGLLFYVMCNIQTTSSRMLSSLRHISAAHTLDAQQDTGILDALSTVKYENDTTPNRPKLTEEHMLGIL